MARKLLSAVLGLMLVCAAVLSAGAHDVPDASIPGSISITITHKGEPVPGGTMTIIRVADVVSQDGNYVFEYIEPFRACTIPVTQLHSSDLPDALADIALDKQVAGTSLILDSKGQGKFSDLEIGLYLLVQHTAAPGYSRLNPFLVSLPGIKDGKYIYDVEATPKIDVEPAPTTAPTQPTLPGGKLPQTGQMNWPVPVLASAGLFCIGIGLCLKASDRRKRYEK